MIPAPLSLISRTLLLGDAKTLESLMQGLLSGNVNTQHFNKTTPIPDAIEACYPRLYRQNETDLAQRRLNKQVGDGLDWLETLFDEYFCFAGDTVTARENRRIEYAQLCAQLHPALPVAWKLSGLVNKAGNGQLVLNDLRRIIEATTTNFLPQPDNDRIWADLHVHLGGAYETSLNLFSMAFNLVKSPLSLPSADHNQAVLARHRQWQASYQTLFNLLLSSTTLEDNENSERPEDRVASQFWLAARGQLELAWRLGHVDRPPLKPKAWLTLQTPSLDNAVQHLAYAAIQYYQQVNPQIAWLHWLTALCIQYRCSTTVKANKHAILAFFHLAQLFRRDMIHDGVGLSRFVRYFNNTIRKAASDQHQEDDGLRHLLSDERQRAELKITDWIADKPRAIQFIKHSLEVLAPNHCRTSVKLENYLQRMHCCVHFIRKPAGNDKFLYASHRRTTLRQAIKINTFLASATASRTRLVNLGLVEDSFLDLTQLIRSLDVAGNELDTPIEVFAPAIRWLRRSPQRSFAPNRKAMRRLHLSIHAGEDFNHLLGGLRHIDETVRFCEMTQQDRLGHALALGIQPNQWFDRLKEVFVSVEEHLDNLVWAWRQAQELAGTWAHAFAVAMRLEARIRIYAPLVYPDYRDQLTPDSLYQAWLLRRNCPLKWQQFHVNGSSYNDLYHWVPDADKPYAKNDTLAYRLYACYQRVQNANAEKITAELNKQSIVLIKAGEQLPNIDDPLSDWVSPIELDFLEAVQDHLLNVYSKRGLAIEVNPSSNVFISHIEDYHHHPIFRWYPPRDEWLKSGERFNRFGLRYGPMPVCVNTDDPGIFPTTLPNEFQLLKEAALKHHSIGSLEADYWIESLRQAGVDRFTHAHTDTLLC